MRSPEATASIRSIDARPSGYNLSTFSKFSPISPVRSPINEGPVARESFRNFAKVIEAPKSPVLQPKISTYQAAAAERGSRFGIENFRTIRSSDIKLATPETYNPAKSVRLFKINAPVAGISQEASPRSGEAFSKPDSGRARMTRPVESPGVLIKNYAQAERAARLERSLDQAQVLIVRKRLEALNMPKPKIDQLISNALKTKQERERVIKFREELKLQLVTKQVLEQRKELVVPEKKKKIVKTQKSENQYQKRFAAVFDGETSHAREENALNLVEKFVEIDESGNEKVDMDRVARLVDRSDHTKSSMLRDQKEKEDGSRIGFIRNMGAGFLDAGIARSRIARSNRVHRPGKWGAEGEVLKASEVKIILDDGASTGGEYLIESEKSRKGSARFETVISSGMVQIRTIEEVNKEVEETISDPEPENQSLSLPDLLIGIPSNVLNLRSPLSLAA